LRESIHESGVDLTELQVPVFCGEGKIVQQPAMTVYEGVFGDDSEISFESRDFIEKLDLVATGENQHFGIIEGIDVQETFLFGNEAVHVRYPPVLGSELQDMLETVLINRKRAETSTDYKSR